MSHIVETLKESHCVKHKELKREFQLIGAMDGAGFSFPCKADGTPDEKAEHYDCWIKNFHMCLEHPEKYEDQGVVPLQWSYMEPALAKCSCGREIHLNGNSMCGCGQWYNQWGQALLDPQYWGEDNCY